MQEKSVYPTTQAKAQPTDRLRFTENEMQELQTLAQKAYANNPMARDLDVLTTAYGEWDLTTQEFALALARNIGGTDYGFVDKLHYIAALADGDLQDNRLAQLPGTVAMLPR